MGLFYRALVACAAIGVGLGGVSAVAGQGPSATAAAWRLAKGPACANSHCKADSLHRAHGNIVLHATRMVVGAGVAVSWRSEL